MRKRDTNAPQITTSFKLMMPARLAPPPSEQETAQIMTRHSTAVTRFFTAPAGKAKTSFIIPVLSLVCSLPWFDFYPILVHSSEAVVGGGGVREQVTPKSEFSPTGPPNEIFLECSWTSGMEI